MRMARPIGVGVRLSINPPKVGTTSRSYMSEDEHRSCRMNLAKGFP